MEMWRGNCGDCKFGGYLIVEPNSNKKLCWDCMVKACYDLKTRKENGEKVEWNEINDYFICRDIDRKKWDRLNTTATRQSNIYLDIAFLCLFSSLVIVLCLKWFNVIS